MREDEILAQFITSVEAATASDYDVRLEGGDQNVTPPEVILSWSTTRLGDANGHNSFGAYIKNQSGENVGVEHHAYYSMRIDCTVRAYSEVEKDKQAHNIRAHFLPVEGNPELFHSDTFEWEVGDVTPRDNAALEPDWYESGVVSNFRYVTRADDTESHTTIEDITYDVEVDETLNGASSDTQ